MPTKYDVFAKIIEKAPCKIKDLNFDSPVYIHVSKLKNLRWVKLKKNQLIPIKNNLTENTFKIIKYCLKSGLDYNLFFSKSIRSILTYLPQSLPKLRPDILKGNIDINNALKYLEANQFILKYSLKPSKGRLLNHKIFDYLSIIHNVNIKIKKIKRIDLISNILKIREQPINPFGKKVFSFLTGSAQLEGSTITEGETIDIILKDVYPDKPAKDIQMVKNLNEAFKFILEEIDSKITTDKIMNINRLIMFSLHSNAGKYKKTHNKIQGNPNFKTANPKDVPILMHELCDEIGKIDSKKECLEKIGFIHNQIQRIHPFSDGNSRTTRMLINWLLLKFGLPILILKMGSFDEYMSLTKLSKKRDDSELNCLFSELIYHENLINS